MTAALTLAVDDNSVSPGVLGFLVVAALGVATWLLIRSMTRQMRKIDFDEDAVDRERPTGQPDLPSQPSEPVGDVEGSAIERRDSDES